MGPPDVSGFAEIALAHIEAIAPYTKERLKKKGFAIIYKEKKYTTSSFYWQKEEEEGVAQILQRGKYEYFPHRLADEDGNSGKMYGILVVANNPFCRDSLKRRIAILSGFSGVATNGIAKIITDDNCLSEFFKLDNEYTNLSQDIEVLIGVEYDIDSGFTNRDTRRIKKITFEKLVKI